MPIYGQVGLFSLAAFALGVLLTWLILARPLRRRVVHLEGELVRRPAPERVAAPAVSAAVDGPQDRTTVFGGGTEPGYPASDGYPASGGYPEQGGYYPASEGYPSSDGYPADGGYPDPREDTGLQLERFTPSHLNTSFDADPVHPSVFDQPEQPVDEQPVAAAGGPPKPAPEPLETPHSEQDAAYFAFLAESQQESTSDQESTTVDSSEQGAEQRGMLRLSTPEHTGEQEPPSGALSGHLAPPPLDESQPEVPRGEPEPEVERTRALFEPARESTFADEFEETTHLPPITAPVKDETGAQPLSDPAAEHPVPIGPFGPGSALPLADGSAPSPEFAVKARTSSMVYHTESSPFYDRLLPQVWFRSDEDAVRAGFTSWERPEGSWGS